MDVISLIGKSSGILTVARFDSSHLYSIGIKDGQIIRTAFNNQDIYDAQQASSFISELIRVNDGEFEYKRGPQSVGNYHIDFDRLLSSALTMSDEIEQLRPHFAEPETRFILRRTPTRLDADLAEFLAAATPYLQAGTSANDLYNQLGLYLEQIQLRLYKLRLAGAIEPARAAFEAGIMEIPPTPEPEAVEEPEDALTSYLEIEEDLADEPLKPIWQPEESAEPETEPLLEEHVAFKAEQEPQAKPVNNYGRPEMSVIELPLSKQKLGSLMSSLKSLITTH